MPKQLQTVFENQFVQGLITEATGINFPDKAVMDSDNTRYNKKGTVTRRLGINHEAGHLSAGDVPVGSVSRSFIWNGVGFEGRRTFLVTQSGSLINFFEAQSGGVYSTGIKSFDIDLLDYSSGVASVTIADKPASFAFGLGKLFIVHPYCEPIYVTYDDATDSITVVEYPIEIRDFEGVEDTLDIDERPVLLSALHKYNLWNQGWWERNIRWGKNESDYPITAFRAAGKGYPSNCDVWWYYKSANSDGDETMDPDMVNTLDIGNSQAPRGHYIYDLFNVDRVAKTGIPGLPQRTSGGIRPSCVAFYAGRVWFGGINHPKYANNVYYTQIIERDEQIGKCYQLNDPTAENLSDLLDTDGGEIRVADMGSLTSFFTSKSNLVLFATNGIWNISGSGAEGTGFVATDFAVSRVSNTSTPSALPIVEAEGTPFWWNFDGIWTIQGTATGGVQVANISNDSIKTFFQNIPPECRVGAQGAYNPLERTIQWVYRSETATNITERYTYDRILEFNLTTGAFYPFSWESEDQRISSIFVANNQGLDRQLYLEVVIDSNGDTVTTTGTVPAGAVDSISGALYSKPSTITSTNLPTGYALRGGSGRVTAFGKEYIITSSPAQGIIQVNELDTTTDTVLLTDFVSSGSVWYNRMTLAGVNVGPSSTASGVTAAVLTPYNYILVLSFDTQIGADTVIATLCDIDADGLLRILGSCSYAPTLGTGQNPSVWHEIAIGGDGTEGASIYAISSYVLSASYNARAWVFPSITELNGHHITSSNGNSAHAELTWATGRFGHHASYRPVGSFYFTIPTGGSGNKATYFYVGPSDINAHTDNAGYYSGNQSGFIDTLKATYPTGFCGKIDLEDLQWPDGSNPVNIPTGYTIDNTFMKDEAGNALIPFDDASDTSQGIGPANTKAYGDWNPKPTPHYMDGKWYLIWAQMLENYSFNEYQLETTLNAKARGRILVLSGSKWTQLDEWEFAPFNWGSDFSVSGDISSKFYPESFSITMAPNGKLYDIGDIYGNDGSTRQMFIGKAGNFVAIENPQPVTVSRYSDQNPPPTRFKYIGMSNYMCICEEVDTKYVDFRAKYDGGKNFESHFTTGAKIPGEGGRVGNVEFFTVLANDVPQGSCSVRAKWDWANSSDSGKWSSSQEVYTPNRSNRDVSRRRLLLRGSGPALQLNFRSTDGKPFELIGWMIWMGTDSVP